MIFCFMALFLIALLMLISNPRQRSSRWASYTGFAASLNFLGFALIHTLIPYAVSYGFLPAAYQGAASIAAMYAVFIGCVLYPYCFLVFALYFSDLFEQRLIKRAAIWLCLPVVSAVCLYLDPYANWNYYVEQHYFIQRNLLTYIVCWVGLFELAGFALLLYSYAREKHPLKKKNRAVVNLLFIPSLLFDLFTGYVAPALQIANMYRINIALGFVLLIIFAAYGTKYGILGVRFRLERQQLFGSMRSFTSGTSTLQHSIKNQIVKINLMGYRINQLVEQERSGEIARHTAHIFESTAHLIRMIERMESSTQDVVLNKKRVHLNALLDQVLDDPVYQEKGLSIERTWLSSTVLDGDEVHLKEMLYNLCSNALDAMEHTNGPKKLAVSLSSGFKSATLSISDNGCGIPKEHMAKVMQPFFTTKPRTGLHFGLGLSYCFQVMDKHNGSLKLFSTPGEGTTVVLQFPKAAALKE